MLNSPHAYQSNRQKKPTEEGGLCIGEEIVLMEPWSEDLTTPLELNDPARRKLEAIAADMAKRARLALQNAEKQDPKDHFGQRFIEHGGMCYFNCWSLLRQFLDDASPASSATPEER